MEAGGIIIWWSHRSRIVAISTCDGTWCNLRQLLLVGCCRCSSCCHRLVGWSGAHPLQARGQSIKAAAPLSSPVSHICLHCALDNVCVVVCLDLRPSEDPHEARPGLVRRRLYKVNCLMPKCHNMTSVAKYRLLWRRTPNSWDSHARMSWCTAYKRKQWSFPRKLGAVGIADALRAITVMPLPAMGNYCRGLDFGASFIDHCIKIRDQYWVHNSSVTAATSGASDFYKYLIPTLASEEKYYHALRACDLHLSCLRV